MAREVRLHPGGFPGRRGRAAGKIPYGAETITEKVRIVHRPTSTGRLYRSVTTGRIDTPVTARHLILAVLAGMGSSILVTALLLIILLT